MLSCQGNILIFCVEVVVYGIALMCAMTEFEQIVGRGRSEGTAETGKVKDTVETARVRDSVKTAAVKDTTETAREKRDKTV